MEVTNNNNRYPSDLHLTLHTLGLSFSPTHTPTDLPPSQNKVLSAQPFVSCPVVPANSTSNASSHQTIICFRCFETDILLLTNPNHENEDHLPNQLCPNPMYPTFFWPGGVVPQMTFPVLVRTLLSSFVSYLPGTCVDRTGALGICHWRPLNNHFTK